MLRRFIPVFLTATLIIVVMDGLPVAGDDLNQPVSIYPKVCQEKLYTHPKGSFKLAVFCDDGAGTNVGVIFHRPGNDWYWFDPEWALCVMSFFWGPKGEYLYLSTNGIYGSGKIYELDLNNKKFRNILPDNYPPTEGTFNSEILNYNTDSNSLECSVEYYHRENEEPVSDIIEIPLK